MKENKDINKYKKQWAHGIAGQAGVRDDRLRATEGQDEAPLPTITCASDQLPLTLVSRPGHVPRPFAVREPRVNDEPSPEEMKKKGAKDLASGVIFEYYFVPPRVTTYVKQIITWTGKTRNYTTYDEHGSRWEFSKDERREDTKGGTGRKASLHRRIGEVHGLVTGGDICPA